MLILRHLINIFLLPLVGFFLILKKFSKINFAIVDTLRIGHITVHFEPFIRENAFTNKKIYIFYDKKICNRYLFELYCKLIDKTHNLKIINNQIIYKILKKLNSISLFYFKSNIYLKASAHENQIKPDWKKYEYFYYEDKILNIENNDIKKGYDLLAKLGISKKDKWICIFNRDSGYLKHNFPSENFSYHDYRDFDVEDLKEAAKHFASKGYFVLRVGKNPVNKIQFTDKKIIDYSFSEIQSDFMDIFILSHCEFFFGGTSGISSVPLIFRKPLFLINCIPIEGLFVYRRKEPCIFKRFKFRNNGKILSIREMIDYKIVSPRDLEIKKNTFYSDFLKKNNIEIVNNTSSEILEFAKESVEIVSQNFKYNENFNLKSKLFVEELKRNKSLKNLKIKNKIGPNFLENTIIQ